MNDKIVKKIGIKQDTGKYIYANIGVDADKDTAHKLIEVNGIKYRKIIYNLWIEDSED